MDVLVVERVFHVTVQVANVRTCFDGKLFLDVLGPDKFAPLLPKFPPPKQNKNEEEEGQTRFSQQQTENDQKSSSS